MSSSSRPLAARAFGAAGGARAAEMGMIVIIITTTTCLRGGCG